MSREQWGNGYWQGIYDAQIGTVKQKEDIQKIAEECLKQMWRFNQSKDQDRSLFHVNELRCFLMACGLPSDTWKKVYDYVMYHQPYGCYISGFSNDPPEEDYFVLANLSYLWEGRE